MASIRRPSPSRPDAELPRVSRHVRPAEMPAADWQAALRRQFGREQAFSLRNLGQDAVFSRFAVGNPQAGSRHEVVVRGLAPGANSCTCLDYATNHLGTCKHIEFVLGRLMRRSSRRLKAGEQARHSALRLDHAGPRRIRFHPGLDCPPRLLERARALLDAEDARADQGLCLAEDRLPALQAFVAAFGRAGHALEVDDAVWAFAAQHRDRRHRQRIFDEAYPKGAADRSLKKLLKARLYPYQLEGALFAARAGRALIGDEMGLGKTVQAIAAVQLMARHLGARRVLVVCPLSLKHQWRQEFARFAGRDAQVVQGLRSQREQQMAAEGDLKILHYEMLARDADLIDAWAPDVVIADEAQRIKNWNTVAARALKRIRSPYALVLTGTPLENRLEELISIVQFVDQHQLGPTWRLLEEHQQRDESGRVTGYRALDRIGQTLAPILLRRRKSEVLAQLPERVEQRVFVPLTEAQRQLHDDNGLTVARIVQRWRQTGYLSDADQRRLQCALQNMRMVCNSTFLLDHETDHGHKVDELMLLLEDLFQTPEAKAVVFSQWRGTHELIVRRLAARGWGHVRFDGQVPGDQRGALVERFQQDAQCRLFLATDAGGVGLNLQHAASVVVNLDLPWNPAVLEQRIGRVHRLGQTRGVQVVNFIGQGSIEEGMLSVLAFKSSLAAGVLDGGAGEVFLEGTRLSRFMQSVEAVAASMGEPEPAPPGGSAVRAAGDPDVAGGVPFAPVAPPSADGLADGLGEPSPAGVDDEEPALPGAGSAPGPRAGDAGAGIGTGVADPWPALLQAGASLLQGLARAREAQGSQAIRIEADPVTGQPSLRLPLPDEQALKDLARALAPWLR